MHTHGSPIPSRLLIPGDCDNVGIPEQSPRSQHLPLKSLSFENFQRLAVRLLSTKKGVIHCQEYGIPGQKQEGIDLYARFQNESNLEVWQCKRYETVTESIIAQAVTDFLKGKLVSETRKFILVTSAETESRTLADAEMAAAKELKTHQIEFSLMGCTQLTSELKKHPEIIDDFFRRDWVEVCCGKDAVEKLGQRLSAQEVPMYRKKLRNLYAAVFEQSDAFGALVSSTERTVTLPLLERWVMPTLSCGKDTVQPTSCSDLLPNNRQEETTDPDYREDDKVKPLRSKIGSFTTAMSAESFLSETMQGVILGDPGSGKSTLLRIITLDLLSDKPSMRELAQRFGTSLPIWLPFAFLSTRISANESITDAAVTWIRKNGGGIELEELLKRAIGDDRLLLLIDGLDEWSDPDRAKEAVVAIRGFLSQHPVSCFMTSRPLGYQRLDPMSGNWRQGSLQPLSKAQQDALVTISLRCCQPKLENQVLKVDVDRFMRQLRLEEVLDDMAENPLMLVGLLSLWLRSQTLPSTRLDVCEALVKEMTEDHLSRKAAISASITTLASVVPEVRRGALASLAWRIHSSADGSFLGRNDAETCFQKYFEQVEGMAYAVSKALARQMLPISAQIIGILSEAGPGGDIQFIHRIFQELLAAEYLASQPFDQQVEYCSLNASNPAWRQVILFLIQKSKRAQESDALANALAREQPTLREKHLAKLLLAEVIFSHIRMTPELRAKYAEDILNDIEQGTWLPFRTALLEKVLQAPTGSNVHTLLIERLNAWQPQPESFFVSDALAEWPKDSGAENAIWSLLNNEDVYSQVRAAKALARRCGGLDVCWKNRLLGRLDTPLTCESLGSSLVSLAKGWFSEKDVIRVFEHGKNSNVAEIVLPSVLGLVKAKKHDRVCKDQLLKYGKSFCFAEFAVEAALEGWPKDNDIKVAALSSVFDIYSPSNLFQKETAWKILIKGYPNDNDVAKAIASEILKMHFDFGYKQRELLVRNFCGHPLIADACREYLKKSKTVDLFNSPIIAALSKTDESKRLLIDWASSSPRMGFHAAKALIWVWGLQDEDVVAFLEQIRGESTQIETYAFIVAGLELDRVKTRKKLLQWLNIVSGEVFLMRVIIEALGNLRTEAPDNEVVETVLKCFEGSSETFNTQYVGQPLIMYFSDHPRVREIADKWMKECDCNWGVIARAYCMDVTIRERIKCMCRCLPTELRVQIMSRCRQRAVHDPEFRSISNGFRLDENEDVRIIGAVTSAEIAISNQEETSSLAKYFAEETVAGGTLFSSRRQAGVAGLIALGQLNKMREQKQYNNETPTISFWSSLRANNLLPQYILKKWDVLKAAYGANLWEYFQSDHELEKISEFARETGQGAIADEIASYLHCRANNKSRSLSFLVENQDPHWVEACFTAMGLVSNGTQSISCQQAKEASRLLAEYGANDDSIRVRLDAFLRAGSVYSTFALETLARGWPNSEIIREIWDRRTTTVPKGRLFLVAICASAEEFVTWLFFWIEEMAAATTHWELTESRWFVMRRCFEDVRVSTLLLERLKESNSTNEWVSLPWLIRGSRLEDANHQLREWAERRWRASDDQTWCVCGFDVFKCKYVPLRETLIEIILTNRGYTLS